MKSVLISIQPYYVFLIIAKAMGWDIGQEKTIEVRKTYPKAEDWNNKVLIYCGKNGKSYKKIPKQYQPFMEKLLGKVVGEFVCSEIDTYVYDCDGVDIDDDTLLKTMLEWEEINIYAKGKVLYGWHTSDLKIYDKPKELSEFSKPCEAKTPYDCEVCRGVDNMRYIKFKGFHPDENGKEKVYVNGEWIKGNWKHGNYIYSHLTNEHIIRSLISGNEYSIIPETVSQYTELKDKNGKEIFENDICIDDFELSNGLIKYDNQDAMFTYNIDTISYDFGIMSAKDCEVIGNIFSNPELIGGGME